LINHLRGGVLLGSFAYDLVPEDLFLQLDGVGALERVYLKIEGLNPAGSIKVKAARIMIARAEKEAGGDLAAGSSNPRPVTWGSRWPVSARRKVMPSPV
jgi:hypothetical protein